MNKKKKQTVLLVHNYYQIPGGEDTVVANEKKLLEDNGHKVILYTRNNAELKDMSKLRKLVLPFTTIFNPKTYKDIRRIIKQNKIDIVHVHNTLNLISPSVYYAARSCKVPVVQTIHNFRLLCPAATFYRDGHICEDCVKHGLMRAVKHNCYRGSKAQTLACVISTKIHRMTGIYGKINYICLTEFNKKKLLELRQIKPERVFVKPNFVNSDLPIIPFEKRKNQFVFAGRLDKLKGIDILFKAWKKLGNDAPELVVCGTGPMEKWCNDFIEKNKITNINMLGFVPNTEAKNIISNSKALILPTQWYEGFPMTIVEAYSVGTPVIGSDMGNVGDLIINEISGVTFVCNKVEELCLAVKKVSTNIFEFSNIHSLFMSNYNSKNNYNKLFQIYRGIS